MQKLQNDEKDFIYCPDGDGPYGAVTGSVQQRRFRHQPVSRWCVAQCFRSFSCDAFGFILPEPPQWFKAAMDAMTSADSLLLNLISVSIFAPIFEEWLCRGMVLRGLLANKMKPVWAIVISALFFAFIHLNPWQALPAFTTCR